MAFSKDGILRRKFRRSLSAHATKCRDVTKVASWNSGKLVFEGRARVGAWVAFNEICRRKGEIVVSFAAVVWARERALRDELKRRLRRRLGRLMRKEKTGGTMLYAGVGGSIYKTSSQSHCLSVSEYWRLGRDSSEYRHFERVTL